MWTSLHIYNYEYEEFLKCLKSLEEVYGKADLSYFFTVYSDMYGYHYRLRLENTTKIDYIYSLFGSENVQENIYDPEIIKYKNNIEAYENISVNICRYIVQNEQYILSNKAFFCLTMILFLNEYFRTNNIEHYLRAIGFWKKSVKFFDKKIKIKGNLLKQIMVIKNENTIFFNNLNKDLKKFKLLSEIENEELSFHLSHMLINRLNLTPKDEVYTYAVLIKQKENSNE